MSAPRPKYQSTTEQVATEFAVSISTVRKWVQKGTLPDDTYLKVGATYRFSIDRIYETFLGGGRAPDNARLASEAEDAIEEDIITESEETTPAEGGAGEQEPVDGEAHTTSKPHDLLKFLDGDDDDDDDDDDEPAPTWQEELADGGDDEGDGETNPLMKTLDAWDDEDDD